MRSTFNSDLIVIQLDRQETLLLDSYGFNFLPQFANIAEIIDNLEALNLLRCFHNLILLVLGDNDQQRPLKEELVFFPDPQDLVPVG